MYAIIVTGGKQYKVSEGDVIFVEKLNAEAEEKVVFDNVLAGATVEGKVIKNGKGKKIRIFKYKPKKGYRRRQGHRQAYTQVAIEKIVK